MAVMLCVLFVTVVECKRKMSAIKWFNRNLNIKLGIFIEVCDVEQGRCPFFVFFDDCTTCGIGSNTGCHILDRCWQTRRCSDVQLDYSRFPGMESPK